MTIDILNDSGKKKYILIALGVLIAVLIVFVVWKFVLSQNESGQIKSPAVRLNINIDFSVLESYKVQEMRLFESIKPLIGTYGRDNPFSSVFQ